MQKNLLHFIFLFLSFFIKFQFAQAQSPGNIGTTNLTAWFNPDGLPLGSANSWQTTYPTGASAITLVDASSPYATVTDTPPIPISNYNKTISFVGNTTTAPMALEYQGGLNLLDNALSTSTGTMFAVYYMNNSSTAAQQIVDYRESSNDAIQLRWLSTTTSRCAIGTSNSTNACRDFPDNGKPMLVSYSGNRSGATTMKFRSRSLEISTTFSSSASTAAQLGLTVGARRNNSLVYSGMNQSYISELIFFNKNLNATENIQVESYLAIKYGVTLDPTATSIGVYKNSTSANVWNSTGALGYHNDVIGIGRDDNSLLNQKQSHTFDDFQKIYLGTLSSTNSSNSSSFSNNIAYLMMGHNMGQLNESATASAEVPTGSGILNRIDREWRVTNTGMSNTFNLDITLNNFINFTSNPSELALLVDNDGDFTNASVFQSGLTFSVSGNIVTISGLSTTQIPLDSTRYITLASISSTSNLPIAGNAISSSSSLCAGSSFNLSLSGASTFSGQQYQWESSIDNITYTPIVGATSSTYTQIASVSNYYRCVVTLGVNSSTSTEIFVTINSLPSISSLSSSPITCNGGNNGIINITSLLASDLFSINPTATQTPVGTFIGLAANTYTVSVVGINTCSTSTTISLSNPPPINVVASPAMQNICQNSLATLTGSGSAITYTWSGGILDATPFTVLSSNTYTVTGTDINNCSNTATAIVTMNALPSVTASPSSQSICENSSATINGNGALSYTWSGGILNATPFTVLSSNTYTVTGTDINNCTNTATAIVTMNALPIVSSSPSSQSICENSSATINGNGALSYTWSGGILNSTPFTVLSSNTYTVTGTDINNCSNTATAIVTMNALPIVTSSPSSQNICENSSATINGNGGLSYSWSGGISNATPFTVLSSNTYTVTGTDINNCTNTATAIVLMNSAPIVNATITPSAICENSSATPSGSGALSYSWSNGLINQVPFVTTPGAYTYTVVGTDAIGCSASTTISLVVNAASPTLSLANVGNINSLTGVESGSNTQTDAMDLNYYGTNCNLIASVLDAVGGTELGFTEAFVHVNSSVLTHNSQPYVNRWFQLTPTTNGSATIKFYLTQNDFDTYNSYASLNGWPLLPTNSSDIIGMNNIGITKVSNAGLGNNPVVLNPSSVVWNALNNYWEISVNTPGFSQFYFHSKNPSNIALPVTLTSFIGKKEGSFDIIEWNTTSEMNNASFNLQYSNDGIHFLNLLNIVSKAENGGISNELLSYDYKHLNPRIGHNYYRLEQVDIDSKHFIFPELIDIVRMDDGQIIEIFPNPSQDEVHISFSSLKNKKVVINILDMSGRRVKQMQMDAVIGFNQFNLETIDLTSGIYTLQFQENGTTTYVGKLIKSK